MSTATDTARPFTLKRFLAEQMRNIAPVFTLIVLVIFFSTQAESFRSFDNMMNILSQASITGIIAVGLTFVTVITAYLHIGVVIGLLPTTGLTLPFVSYGRSNIVLTMFLTGILVNIGSTKERVIGSGATDPLAVRAA